MITESEELKKLGLTLESMRYVGWTDDDLVAQGWAVREVRCETTDAIVAMLRQSDIKGVEEYGNTVDRTDLTADEWIDHAASELGDALKYLFALKRTLPPILKGHDPDKAIALVGKITLGECGIVPVRPVMAEVSAERNRQNKQWGGPAVDDKRDPTDWFRYINYQREKWRRPNGASYFREAMIKTAALAIAAVESHDRKEGKT